MKRLVLSGLLIVSGLMLYGCDPDTTTPVSYAPQESFYRVRTDVIDFDSDAREIAQAITSRDALDTYINDIEAIYNLTQDTPSFITLTEHYDEAFFENNILVLIPLEEPSGAISHFIDDIIIESEVLTINILRSVPSVGTTDMAAWHLIIPLEVEENAFESIEINTID